MTDPSSTRLDLRPLEVRLPELEPATVELRTVRPRPAPRLVELQATPARTPGGCRTRVDGVRCGHLAAHHHQVGHGVQERCVGCGCRAYRDPWPRAILTVLIGLVVGLVAAAAGWALIVWALGGWTW